MQGLQRTALLVSILNCLAAIIFSFSSVFFSSVQVPITISSGVAPPYKAEWERQVLLSFR